MKKEGKQIISRNEQELKDDFKRLKRAVEKMEEDRNAFVARLSIDDMGSDYKKEQKRNSKDVENQYAMREGEITIPSLMR